MQDDNDLWGMFWRPVLFLFLVAAIVSSCSGCAGNDPKPSLTQVIKAVKDACETSGGVSKIEFDNQGEETRVDSGSCHPGKIYVR